MSTAGTSSVGALSLSSLVHRLPKLVMSGNHTKGPQAHNQRKPLEKMLNMVRASPNICHDLAQFGEGFLEVEHHAALGGGSSGPTKADTPSGAGDDFRVEWFASHASLSKQALALVFAHGTQGVDVEYVFKAPGVAKVGQRRPHTRGVLNHAAFNRASNVEGDRALAHGYHP